MSVNFYYLHELANIGAWYVRAPLSSEEGKRELNEVTELLHTYHLANFKTYVAQYGRKAAEEDGVRIYSPEEIKREIYKTKIQHEYKPLYTALSSVGLLRYNITTNGGEVKAWEQVLHAIITIQNMLLFRVADILI